MPGPFQITGALAQGSQYGYSPAYEYGGNLFVLAFSSLDTGDADSNPLLSIFKSDDGGETWAQVGSDKTLPSTNDIGFVSNANAGFSTCQDNADTSIVYACYIGAGTAITLSRADLDAEDWGSDDVGPAYPTEGGNAATPPQIAQADTGEIAAIFCSNIDVTVAFRLRAYVCLHTGGAWGSALELDGQSDDDETFEVTAISTGADGRVHGFVTRQVGSDIDDTSVPDVCHVLLLPEPGSLETITTSATLAIDDGRPITAYDGSRVACNVLRISESSFVGVETAHATSADSPSWTLTSLDADAVAMFSDGGLRGVYNDGADVVQAAFDGAWGAASVVIAGFAQKPNPSVVSDGLGIVFEDAGDLYYFTTAITGGGGDVLTGETIPTAEQFFSTHGITGGGTENCGPVTVTPPEPGCNGNPGGPIDPNDRNTCNVGAGFSF